MDSGVAQVQFFNSHKAYSSGLHNNITILQKCGKKIFEYFIQQKSQKI